MNRTILIPTILLTGCIFGKEEIVFPPGLEPLEENRAPWPTGTQNDPYPETIEVISGESDSYYWAHGRGFIQAPIEETWQALQDPEVNVDRRKVDSWSSSRMEVPNCEIAYVIHNRVDDVVTVEFDVTWCHGQVAGESGDPDIVGIRFQKTDGSDFIDSMLGSLVLYRKEKTVTAVEYIEHLDAIMVGTPEVENTIKDLHASAVAKVHDNPLPTW